MYVFISLLFIEDLVQCPYQHPFTVGSDKIAKRSRSFVQPLTLLLSLKTHYYQALRHTTMRPAMRP